MAIEFDLSMFERRVAELLQPHLEAGKLTADELAQLKATGVYMAKLQPSIILGDQDAIGKAKMVWATVLSIAEKKQYELEKDFKALLLSAFETVASAGMKAVFAAL